MALSIKTAEADDLARSLARLTGENMTQAVTVALRERLARERAKRERADSLPARIASLVDRMNAHYDTRPLSRAEWDAAPGDEVPLLFVGDDFGSIDIVAAFKPVP